MNSNRRFFLSFRKINSTVSHIQSIETDIQELKKKLERDSAILMEHYSSFEKLKNDILGIEMDEEDGMDVEE